MVDALFVDSEGPYPALLGPERCWDAARDARTYAGSNPVVCHPPCQLWVNFAALNFKRYGGEHNRPGNDGGCFEFALKTVRSNGGVLEHPMSSNAWPAFGLKRPEGPGWNRIAAGEWVCEIWQTAYGHLARKRTWLLYVGASKPIELNWDRKPGVAQVGWFDRIKPTLGKKESSRTPPAFAKALISLAATSQP